MDEIAESLKCGIIMPISSIDGCNESHWIDVKEILKEAIVKAGFKAELVSYSDDVGIIQKRIIQNLYENPVVVCDVSGKNSNVMFELGMRLAFDKPTIIIKDDKTAYSFDTSVIEHLEYPRDLRYSRIIEFKEKLILKIKATYEKANNEKDYTTFLKQFGKFSIVSIETKEITKEDYILEELKELRKTITSVNNKANAKPDYDSDLRKLIETYCDPYLININPKADVTELYSVIFSTKFVQFLINKRGLDENYIRSMIFKYLCDNENLIEPNDDYV